ncbi:MAG: hypothetical protein H7099_06285, partial [Gemmatimonadaceae bacterium]|nr:hypothetical protein [Gemmatimonadaceae bacterium]
MNPLSMASQLWSLRWVRGGVLAVGVLVAVVGNGVIRHHYGYRDGRRDGVTAERALATQQAETA